jgi:hypothetical protein
MQILANSTRDVEILAQLKVASTTTTNFEHNIAVGSLSDPAEIALQVGASANISNNLTVNGDLIVGSVNIVDSLNPYWVAVVITFVGGVPTIARNGGRYPATSLIRQSGQAVGVIQFDFPEHPQGTNYIYSAGGSGAYTTLSTGVRTSTRIGIVIRNSTTAALVDAECHVLILAY